MQERATVDSAHGVLQIRTIINGHIPVKTIKGESPIKADGKLLVIDGGYSKAYQPETGIAGYTLIYNSQSLKIVQHAPFTTREKAVKYGLDILSETKVLEFEEPSHSLQTKSNGHPFLIFFIVSLLLVAAACVSYYYSLK